MAPPYDKPDEYDHFGPQRLVLAMLKYKMCIILAGPPNFTARLAAQGLVASKWQQACGALKNRIGVPKSANSPVIPLI